MTPTRMMILGRLLAGCAGGGGEQNFSQNDDDGEGEQGVADLSLSAEYLVFTEVNYEQVVSKSQPLTVTNIGDNELKVSTIDIADSGGGVFYVFEEHDVIIAPGASEDFEIVATMTQNTPAVGSLRLETNDAEYLNHRLPLCAFPAGWAGSVECAADTGEDTGDTGGEDSGS